MTITGIATNVQALLEETGYFTSVLPHPPKDNTVFNGFPSVCHYYSGGSPNVATVSQNRRTLQYTVELYYQSDNTTNPATQFSELNTLIDNTVQMFDETIDLSEGLGVSLGLTRACDFLAPAAGEMLPVETNEGEALMVTIHLFCSADVSFR